jgi:hypothetical protein
VFGLWVILVVSPRSSAQRVWGAIAAILRAQPTALQVTENFEHPRWAFTKLGGAA